MLWQYGAAALLSVLIGTQAIAAPSGDEKKVRALATVRVDGAEVIVDLSYQNEAGRPLCIGQLFSPAEDGAVHYDPIELADETGEKARFRGTVLDVNWPEVGYDIVPPHAILRYFYHLSSHYDLTPGHTYNFQIVIPAVDCAVFENGYAFPGRGSSEGWEKITGQPAANLDGKRYSIETGSLHFSFK